MLWSTASHWVLGVPFDMVQRAKRHGEQAQIDMEQLVRINCNRLLFIGHASGLLMLAFGSASITALVIMGFWYSVEFAQALFFFVFPMSIISVLSLSTAHRISSENADGELLQKRLSRHRFYTQIIGMISVFVTAMWGMFQNLLVGPFG